MSGISQSRPGPCRIGIACVRNLYRGNPASLIIGKAYHTVDDAHARDHGLLRVVDEDTSEPDGYLYSASMFVSVELPDVAKRALLAAGS